MEQAPSPAEPEFPNGPCKKGNVYVMDSPFGQRLIIMAEESWGDFGTRQETMRQLLAAQDKRIKELLAENAVAKDRMTDALTRLDNIRAARRNEYRERIEGQAEDLVLPGDRKFSLDLTKRKQS